MLLQGPAEGVAAGAIGNEVQLIRLGRPGHRL
jgi:hypothetical protein